MTPSRDLHGWQRYLGSIQLPVLTYTPAALQELAGKMDTLSARHLSQIILRDPLMALQVIMYLQNHQGRLRNHDITTIGQALLMLGMGPFFRHFSGQRTIDSLLATQPEALQRCRAVISRARLAALYAHRLAELRHDTDSEEVMLAALLHDIAEILLWCFAPEHMIAVSDLLRAHPGMRSAEAQQRLLGFNINQLQHLLITEWRLPQILQTLMNEAKPDNSRTACTVMSVDLARHASYSWQDPGVEHDLAAMADILHLSVDEIWRHMRDTALLAAEEWPLYGVRPVAAKLVETAGDRESSPRQK